MTKLSKYILAVGFVLGLVLSVAVGVMALDHNPQMEYTLNPENLAVLCLMGFAAGFLPCVVFALVCEIICRVRVKKQAL